MRGARHAVCRLKRPMSGIRVTVNVTYCGHSLQAEAELNRTGEWLGQCVVGGSAFKRRLVLETPRRTPTAALDAILAAGRRWVDEQQGIEDVIPIRETAGKDSPMDTLP
jgi:hypothetical protein